MMAGLLDTAQQGMPDRQGQQQADAADGMAGQGAGVAATNFNGEDQEGDPNVTEEEQQQYDAFVKNAMEMVYTPEGKVLPEILKRLAGSQPVESLAQTAVWLVSMVVSSADAQKAPVADDVVFHAGREVLEQLADVATSAGLHDFTDKEMGDAWYSALDMYRESATQAGKFDPQAATDEFVALNKADQEGKADEVLPGFTNLAHKEQVTLSNKERGEPTDQQGATQ